MGPMAGCREGSLARGGDSTARPCLKVDNSQPSTLLFSRSSAAQEPQQSMRQESGRAVCAGTEQRHSMQSAAAAEISPGGSSSRHGRESMPAPSSTTWRGVVLPAPFASVTTKSPSEQPPSSPCCCLLGCSSCCCSTSSACPLLAAPSAAWLAAAAAALVPSPSAGGVGGPSSAVGTARETATPRAARIWSSNQRVRMAIKPTCLRRPLPAGASCKPTAAEHVPLQGRRLNLQ